LPRYEQRTPKDYSNKICPLTLFTNEPKLCVTDGCAAWKGGDYPTCTIIGMFSSVGFNMQMVGKRAYQEVRKMAGYSGYGGEKGGEE
jgi:hypothetical protein